MTLVTVLVATENTETWNSKLLVTKPVEPSGVIAIPRLVVLLSAIEATTVLVAVLMTRGGSVNPRELISSLATYTEAPSGLTARSEELPYPALVTVATIWFFGVLATTDDGLLVGS